LVSSNICDPQPRGDHAKPRIEGCEFAQERLERRLTEPSLLWTRRILERLQAVQNEQGSAMRDELRESLALLPRRSEPRIGVTKPRESGIKKFICRGSTSTTALSVKGPAKNQFRGAILLSCYASKPMVDECGLSDPRPGNDCNNVRRMKVRGPLVWRPRPQSLLVFSRDESVQIEGTGSVTRRLSQISVPFRPLSAMSVKSRVAGPAVTLFGKCKAWSGS